MTQEGQLTGSSGCAAPRAAPPPHAASSPHLPGTGLAEAGRGAQHRARDSHLALPPPRAPLTLSWPGRDVGLQLRAVGDGPGLDAEEVGDSFGEVPHFEPALPVPLHVHCDYLAHACKHPEEKGLSSGVRWGASCWPVTARGMLSREPRTLGRIKGADGPFSAQISVIRV